VPDDRPADLSDDLLELAHRYGVVPDFWGYDGSHQWVSRATIVAVLAALGVDASSPERVAVEVGHAEDEVWRRMLPPVLVVRQGQEQHVAVHVEDGAPVRTWVELEDGAGERDVPQVDVYTPPRTVDGRLVGRAAVQLPADLPLGWHTLVAQSGDTVARGTLVVVPGRLPLAAGLEQRRGWGFMTQLYSVRSERSWGVGDLTDLADLAWGSGHAGADFLLVNPLHAGEAVAPLTPSPYLPTTRQFVHPIYVRPEAIPETAYLPVAERSLVEWQAEVARPLSQDPGPIDRDAAWAAKKVALEIVFAAPRSGVRQARFDAFRASLGQALDDFATWCALDEHLGHVEGLESWPAEALDRTSPYVQRMRAELADRVEFYAWLQWVADEQLAAAQAAALEGGMRVGLMLDLAVGVHPRGADVWSQRDVFARAVSVGAPPDMYNQQGQDWSEPPWRPDALVKSAYRPFRDMLRTALRHAGALRIDHVIGLFRLWWIPAGHSPREGAYVRYDHEALIGILCLEAQRAGAVIIGEDLGTFEPWVRDYLSDRGVLGTSVLWFESENGGVLPPERYRRLALATVTTHDLPPTAGYLAGEHVDLRDRLGLLGEPVQVVRADALAERERMVTALRERGLVGDQPSERELVEALHRFLLAAPSVLVGVSLADAVGERRAQNQPGTDREYPNWRVPLADSAARLVGVDELFEHQRLRSLVAALRG